MKIAVAGGLGFEPELVQNLPSHTVTLVGSTYDLKKERFVRPDEQSVSFTGEYLTHNYSQILSGHDVLIDISGNRKSVFLMNDAAVRFGKKFIAVFHSDGWKAGSFQPAAGTGCLRCYMDYTRPVPPVAIPPVHAVDAVQAIVEALMAGASGIVKNLENGETRQVTKNESCPAEAGNFRFLNGEMADIAAVSCSDHSVAITPLNEMPVDLAQYKKYLETETKIVKESQFFIQFKLMKFDCTLFRLGRMVVKGTKEKNTGLYIYRHYLGT